MGFMLLISINAFGEDSESPTPFVRRWNIENNVDFGSACFDVSVTDPELLQLNACKPGKYRIAYSWAPERKWRIDVTKDDGSPVTTLICDGKSIDAGSKIWDAGYLYFLDSTPNKQEFMGLLWPFDIVAKKHFFSITAGRTTGLGIWSFGKANIQPIKQDEMGRMLCSVQLTFGGNPSHKAKDLDPKVRKIINERPFETFEYVFDVKKSFLPIRECIVDASDELLAGMRKQEQLWKDPVEVRPARFFPSVYEVSTMDDKKVICSSRLVMERSKFTEPPDPKIFQITNDGKKTFIEYPNTDVGAIRHFSNYCKKKFHETYDLLY
jgi:hypothetical protein